MMTPPIAAGTGSPIDHHRAAPLTGVMIGTAISLVLWALILAFVFIV